MTDQPTTPTPDTVPARVRTVVYYAALAMSALVLLGQGLGVIFWPEVADEIQASGGVITSVVLLVTSGLGVAYAPTRR